MEATTILITGGLGFLGGRIARPIQETTPHFVYVTTRKTNIENPDWLNRGKIISFDQNGNGVIVLGHDLKLLYSAYFLGFY